MAMVPQTALSWSEALQALKDGGIDILPTVAITPARRKFMNFTKPYLSFPLVIASNRNSPYISGLSDLDGKKVGVIRDYYSQDVIETNHPEIVTVKADSVAHGLELLSDGEIDAFVDNLGVITYEKDRLGLADIKIAAPTKYQTDLSMGVRKDWPELIPILNKALDTIDKKERATIKNTWLAVHVEFGLDIRTILVWAVPLGGAAVVVVVVVVLWNRKLGREIGERKKAEAELLRKDEQLRLALDNMSDGIYVIDPEMRFVIFNDRYRELMGVPDGLIYPGSQVYDLTLHLAQRGAWGEGDAEEMAKQRIAALANDEIVFSETVTEHGRVVETRKTPLKGGGCVGVLADITDRKRVETVLRESEQRLLSILQESPVAISVIRASNDTIAFVNERYNTMFGVDENEAFGQTPLDLFADPNERDAMLADFKRDGWIHDREIRFKRADGQAFWGLMTLMRFEYEGAPARLAWIYDITERKLAEQALEFTQYSVDHAAEAIFWVRPADASLVYVNEAACVILGYSQVELLALRVPDFDAAFTESRVLELKDALTREDSVSFESQHRAKNGDLVDVEVTVYLADSQGQALLVATAKDITDRKAAEAALLDARDAAEEATRSKSAFLAAMSHEIRTPMNGVVGMIDLLGESELDADQRQMMGTVRDSAFSLLQIINDILDFSKIEAGKLELEQVPVSIRDAVEGVVETLAPIADKKHVRLSSFIDPALPAWVLGDQVRMRQILFNLAGNAVKFTETSKAKQGVVDVLAELAADEDDQITVRFSIKDNGIGMSQEQIGKLFEPFTQAEGSTTRRFGGTGLGLSICKNLTEIMAGEIGATSVPGEGSVFTADLTLPRDDTRKAPGDEPDLAGVSVLILTEHRDAQRRYEIYLAAWHASPNWETDLEKCSEHLHRLLQEGGGPVVLLICSDIDVEVRHALIAGLRTDDRLKSVRFAVMSHAQGEQFGMVMPDQMVIRDRPLRRSALIHGVAVAAGRASPEVATAVEKIGVESHELPSVDEARAAGQLILLAEDNPTNQDVIGRQLNRLGYQMEIADDGEIAVKMWRGGSYGLLLTDCHMPNMDGYELTAAIREAQADSGERLSIVAITANALQGEAERCLAAGMDDYLSKPVEMRLLKQMLAKWLPRERSFAGGGIVPAVQPPEPTATGPDDAPVDSAIIKEMFGDDDELVAEILGEFVEPAGNNVEEILAAWEGRDAAGVGSAAHKLKSSARTVGANKMADLCALLEAAGKAGDAERIEQNIGNLEPSFKVVKNYIEQLALG